jgi:hypothetical protein
MIYTPPLRHFDTWFKCSVFLVLSVENYFSTVSTLVHFVMLSVESVEAKTAKCRSLFSTLKSLILNNLTIKIYKCRKCRRVYISLTKNVTVRSGAYLHHFEALKSKPPTSGQKRPASAQNRPSSGIWNTQLRAFRSRDEAAPRSYSLEDLCLITAKSNGRTRLGTR